MNMPKLRFPMAALLAALVAFSPAFAEPDDAEAAATESVPSADAALALDASSLSAAFDASGVSSYKCRAALKDFEKAVADANAAAVSQRAKVAEVARKYLTDSLEKARTAGDLDKVLVFQKALETVDGEIAGGDEAIVKLRNGRAAQLDKIDKGLVASGLTAAKALDAHLELQKKEITQKGEIETALKVAAFQKQVEEWAKKTRGSATGGATSSLPAANRSSEVRRPAHIGTMPASAREAVNPIADSAATRVRNPSMNPRNQFEYTRSPAMRTRLLLSGGGNAKTEAAVLRSLRWLKQNQQADGSWKNQKTAMTGFAVLTFLAHGERPGPDSPEFGETVQRALGYLTSTFNIGTGTWQVHDGNNYSHLIATYALCEACGMTEDPDLRDIANRALDRIIQGQNVHGGWDYKMNAASDRNDLSFIGWAAQALHAAEMAGFYHDPASLRRACENAVKGIKRNGLKDGGFGYTSPAKGGLTSVGTLCLQFHGAANDPMVRNSLKNIICRWSPEWVGATPDSPEVRRLTDVRKPSTIVSGSCPQYYYYYGTQAVFQAGGENWKKWNEKMWSSYVKAQLVQSKEESGYIDHKGEPQETGYWINADVHGDRPVMDTCLAALQLMTYYRYPSLSRQGGISSSRSVSPWR